MFRKYTDYGPKALVLILILTVLSTGVYAAEEISFGEEVVFSEGDKFVLDERVNIDGYNVKPKVKVNDLYNSSNVTADVTAEGCVNTILGEVCRSKEGEVLVGNRYEQDDFSFYFCSARAHYSNETVYNGTAIAKKEEHPPMKEVCETVGVEKLKDTTPEFKILQPENKTYSSDNISLKTVSNSDVQLEWSYALNDEKWNEFTPNQTTLKLENDRHVLDIKVDDGYGNKNSSSVFFAVDTEPPELSYMEPTSETSPRNRDWLEFNISATDESRIKEVKQSLNNTNHSLNKSSGNYWKNYTELQDGEYSVKVWAEDSVGNKAEIEERQYHIDTSRPLIDIFKPKKNSFSNENIELEVSADEEIAEWKYRLNNSQNSTFEPNTTIENISDGVKELEVFGKDKAGNWNHSTTTVYVDGSPPELSYNPSTTTAEKLNKNTISVNISVKDANLEEVKTGFNEKNVSFSENDSSNYWTKFTDLKDGKHKLWVWARDESGNFNRLDTREYILDTQPPEIEIFSPLNKTHNSERIKLKVDADEEVSEWTYRINEKAKKKFSPNTSLDLSNGKHKLEIYAEDSFNNTASKTTYFHIDSRKPQLELHRPEKKNYSSRDIQLEVSASESTDSWKYNLDSSDNRSFQPNTTLEDLEEDTYILNIWAQDTAGNWNSVTKKFGIDISGPDITIKNPENKTYNSEIEIGVDTDENVEELIYSLNNGNNLSLSGEQTILEDPEERQNKLNVYGRDGSGNWGQESVEFTFDETPPEIIFDSETSAEGYRNKNWIKIGFSASDNIEVSDITAELNESKIQLEGTEPYSENHTNLSDGNYILDVLAEDKAGNAAEIQKKFIIDTEKPDIDVSDPENRLYQEQSVELKTASNEKTDWAYILNGEKSEFTPNTTIKPEEGPNSLQVLSTDQAGNTVNKSVNFRVDSKAPRLEYNPSSTTSGTLNSPEINVNVSAKDRNLQKVKISFNGENQTLTSGTENFHRNYENLEDGNYSLWVWADDEAGNFNRLKERKYFIDTKKPQVKIWSPENKLYSDQKIEIGVTSDKEIVEWKYKIDESDNTSFTPNNSIEGIPEGRHNLEIWSKDKNGNWNRNNTEFTIDRTSPEINIEKPGKELYGSEKIIVDPKSSEKIRKWKYSINEGSNNTFTPGEKIEKTEEGLNILNLWAEDQAGNWGMETTEFRVDTSPPSFTILKPENKTYGRNQIEASLNSTETANWSYQIDSRETYLSKPSLLEGLSDGRHKLKVRAEDDAENKHLETVVFKINTSSPEIRVQRPQNKFYSRNNLSVNYSSTSKIGEWKYSLDNEENTTMESIISLENLSDGEHSLRVWGRDKENGRWGFKNRVFHIDTKKPVIELWNNSTSEGIVEENQVFASISLEEENLETLEISLNNRTTRNTPELNYTNLSEGNYTLTAEAVDRAGNTNKIHRNYEVKPSEPEIEVLEPTNRTYTESEIELHVKPETASDILFSIDNGENQTLKSNREKIEKLGSGKHHLVLWHRSENDWTRKEVHFTVKEDEDPEPEDGKESRDRSSGSRSSGSIALSEPEDGKNHSANSSDNITEVSPEKRTEPDGSKAEEKDEQQKDIENKTRENQPPEASFTIMYPSENTLKDGVVFDASKSHDEDGEIVEYRWSFGETGKTVGKRFDVHEKEITLTVEDSDGATESVTGTIRSESKSISLSSKLDKKNQDEKSYSSITRSDSQKVTGEFSETREENATFLLSLFMLISTLLMSWHPRIDFP